MTLAQRVAVVLVGCLLAAAVYAGARAATQGPKPRKKPGQPLDPHGLDLSTGVGMRKGVDPLNPPGMPAGAMIDLETGLLRGVSLKTRGGEQVLEWIAMLPADKATDKASLPAALLELDGRAVVVAGFLMPLYEITDIRDFALVGSHYTCCFGTPPGLGGQILVSLAKGQAGLAPTVKPLAVRGTFRIRAQHLRDDGTGPLVSLFEIVDAKAATLGY